MVDAPSHLPPLIRHMLHDKNFTRSEATEPIRLIQTHISYVLLTGKHAYKIKKPVDLKFVDFSSLDHAGIFAMKKSGSISAGRRISMSESSPSTGEKDGFHLLSVAPGSIVEYAVKMRQFPQEALFSSMLAENKIGAAEAEAAQALHGGSIMPAAAVRSVYLRIRPSRSALRRPSRATIGKPGFVGNLVRRGSSSIKSRLSPCTFFMLISRRN